MSARREPTFDPESAAHAIAEELPHIETPVIHMEDLEHKPGPDTRVDNSGVPVHSTSLSSKELAEYSRQDQRARKAVEELEESIKNLPPG